MQQQQPALGAGAAAGRLGLPLAGRELQAAIAQKRSQLRPLQETPAHQRSAGGIGAPPPSSSSSQDAAIGGSGLDAVLRRGLERFNFRDQSGSSESGS